MSDKHKVGNVRVVRHGTYSGRWLVEVWSDQSYYAIIGDWASKEVAEAAASHWRAIIEAVRREKPPCEHVP